jgi:anti-anti-sigma factor
MQRSSLEAATHMLDEELVIELRGDIDGSARETLTAAYGEAPSTSPVLLDFASVEYINSTGIALIVRARGLSAHYREIFEITRLSDFMTILADDAPPHHDEHGAPT